MTNRPPNQLYKKWINERRHVVVDASLVPNIMRQVNQTTDSVEESWWSRLFQRMEESWTARCVACGGALAVGCVPFILAVQVASL